MRLYPKSLLSLLIVLLMVLATSHAFSSQKITLGARASYDPDHPEALTGEILLSLLHFWGLSSEIAGGMSRESVDERCADSFDRNRLSYSLVLSPQVNRLLTFYAGAGYGIYEGEADIKEQENRMDEYDPIMLADIDPIKPCPEEKYLFKAPHLCGGLELRLGEHIALRAGVRYLIHDRESDREPKGLLYEGALRIGFGGGGDPRGGGGKPNNADELVKKGKEEGLTSEEYEQLKKLDPREDGGWSQDGDKYVPVDDDDVARHRIAENTRRSRWLQQHRYYAKPDSEEESGGEEEEYQQSLVGESKLGEEDMQRLEAIKRLLKEHGHENVALEERDIEIIRVRREELIRKGKNIGLTDAEEEELELIYPEEIGGWDIKRDKDGIFVAYIPYCEDDAARRAAAARRRKSRDESNQRQKNIEMEAQEFLDKWAEKHGNTNHPCDCWELEVRAVYKDKKTMDISSADSANPTEIGPDFVLIEGRAKDKKGAFDFEDGTNCCSASVYNSRFVQIAVYWPGEGNGEPIRQHQGVECPKGLGYGRQIYEDINLYNSLSSAPVGYGHGFANIIGEFVGGESEDREGENEEDKRPFKERWVRESPFITESPNMLNAPRIYEDIDIKGIEAGVELDLERRDTGDGVGKVEMVVNGVVCETVYYKIKGR